MPKEIRNPKSDWRRVLNDSKREDSAFWTWRDDDVANAAILREEPSGKGTPLRNLMERVAQFGTSLGANYCEADDAVSGRDFKNKIGTSRKESKETMFFLRMVAASEESLAEEARELWREAKELNLIFGSMWRK